MSVKSEPSADRAFRVLIVDDDPVQRRLSEAHVARAGGLTDAAASLQAARALLREGGGGRFAAVLLDLGLPDGDGLDLLRQLRGAGDSVPVVVQTGEGRLDRAVEAMRAGATDFLVKPVSPARVRAAIEAAIRAQAERDGGADVPEMAPSPAMRPVLDAADRVSRSMVPVLVLGETGVGKEWLARRIARASARASKPFVAVNCGALPRDLSESILFGFERGAFTGAERSRPGKFAQADGGTLFLDEVGELAPETQVKLLRALQEGEIDPIGSTGPVRVDVRVIAATHRDLGADVAAGRFREDLFYRLHVFPISIPPLRERREEIAALARRFAAEHLPGADLTPAALARLERHGWPGNIRELENAIRRAAVMADGAVLQAEDFELADSWSPEKAKPLSVVADIASPMEETADEDFPTLAQVERAHILRALQHCEGQPTKAARLLRIGRTTLYRKLKEYGLSLPESPA
ncbi:hypothetical protein M673_16110 [Aureimonas sp. AU20]|uniref:sigma-54-dependent transcriptional regulator n=1 Tax=Aureimonas sp. AU20 TaxID=1349819 RepID=UPI00072103D8|nr:sigma-54 dependent transcriptional regulator [Aureimonas sp. AU20]ALN74251.1 hypothetical protein M673_16110 [Aureimonas sp. AU20]